MTTPFAPQILSPKPTRRRALNLEITALPTCHIFVLNFQKEFYFTSKRLIEQLKSCALFLTRVPTSKISCAIRRSTTGLRNPTARRDRVAARGVDPKTKDREVPFLSVIFPALVEDHTSVGFELGSRRACQCDSFQVTSSRNKGGALFLSEKALLEVIGEVVFLDPCTSSDFSRSSCTHRTTTPRDTDA
jgi:hypothetical protein